MLYATFSHLDELVMDESNAIKPRSQQVGVYFLKLVAAADYVTHLSMAVGYFGVHH